MRDITNYEGLYAITSCGRVWSYRSKKFLKPAKTKNGYLVVNLSKDGRVKTSLVHKLVAEAYIENFDNLETVDHIDGNKEHNYVKNLQWMSRGKNSIKGNNIKVKCVETGEIFESMTIAAKQKNLNINRISEVCLGKRKTHGGYHWEVV